MHAPVITRPDPTSVIIRRSFDADVETLWNALLTPEGMSHWMGAKMAKTGPIDVDLRVGGTYTIEMHGDSGELHRVSGEYLELDPPRRAVFSWAWYTTPDRVSRVTYALSPQADGRTMLTLTHERLFSEEVADNHAQGWTLSLESLDEYFAPEGAS